MPPRWFKNIKFGEDLTNIPFKDIVEDFKQAFSEKLADITFESTGPIIEEIVSEDDGPIDEGPVDEGPIDEDPIDEGPIDDGPIDDGPIDEGPMDEGPIDKSPIDEGPVDEEPIDEDPVDEGPIDEGPIDEGPIDEDPIDEDPIDEDPIDEGPIDDGPIDDGPIDDGPIDDGPIDDGPIDDGPIDEGPMDEGPMDEGPIDKSPIDEGPMDDLKDDLENDPKDDFKDDPRGDDPRGDDPKGVGPKDDNQDLETAASPAPMPSAETTRPDGLRRSQRQRIRPLNFARGERIIYDLHKNIIGHEQGFPEKYDYSRRRQPTKSRKPFANIPNGARPIEPVALKVAKKGNYRFTCKQVGGMILGSIVLGPRGSKPEAKTTPNQNYSFIVAKGQVLFKTINHKGSDRICIDENHTSWIDLPPGMRYSFKNCGPSEAVIGFVVRENQN